MRRTFHLLPQVILLLIVTYFPVSIRPGHDGHKLPLAMVEQPAPGFDLAGLDDSRPLALEALKRQPFVINFFASGYVPCRIEHPPPRRMAAQNHVPLYGIAYKDKLDDSTRLLTTFGDPYRPVGVDQDLLPLLRQSGQS